jgi:hypothetical protein
MRKVLDHAGTGLSVIGLLLIIGSVAAWQLGPETLTALYERTRPVLPFFLTGLGFVVLGCLLSPANVKTPGTTPPATGPLPGAGSAGDIRCSGCGAINGSRARFCDQCGAAISGHQPPPTGRYASGSRTDGGPGLETRDEPRGGSRGHRLRASQARPRRECYLGR